MAQNIYDSESFFSAYANLPRSKEGLAAAPEWPSLQRMLGPLQIKRILDLGCGYGWFCRYAAQAGAPRVHGVDISERMIARARVDDNDSNTNTTISYEICDLDTYTFLAEEKWDIVYSSLALHYLNDLDRLFSLINLNLTDGGKFVFSVEHPISTAPTDQTWMLSASGKKLAWPMNSYSKEGFRDYEWLGSSVKKYHRTMETYIRLLLRNGFTLVDLEEWRPTDEQLIKFPDWKGVLERPIFLLMSARKNAKCQ